MIIVGELINASRKPIRKAIETGDEVSIRKIASSQCDAGASFIDVNAGVFEEREAAHLGWLVRLAQEATGLPCSVDSPDPNAIEAALDAHSGPALVNSISMEEARLEPLLAVLAGTEHKAVALCMNDEGMPETRDQRLAIAGDLINRLVKAGVDIANIYVDPLVQPLSTDAGYGVEFLAAVQTIMETFPGIHTICGLSNVSFGLPRRKVLNRTFISMAIAYGLDAAIINPLDEKMMTAIISATALAGKDAWCEEYLNAFRANRLAD